VNGILGVTFLVYPYSVGATIDRLNESNASDVL